MASDEHARVALPLALQELRGECEWGCTTCAGYTGMVHRLRVSYREQRAEYVSTLAALGAAEFADIGDKAPLARAALDVMEGSLDVGRVLAAWADTVADSPDVALVVLHMAGPHLQRSPRLVRTLLVLAETRSVLAEHLGGMLGPVALEHRALWDHARESLQAEIGRLHDWAELQRRADTEHAERRAAWEREWNARQRARAAEVERLSRLPLPERLPVLARRSSRLSALEDDLARHTEAEVRALDADAALMYARMVDASATEPWRALKHALMTVHDDRQREEQRNGARLRMEEIAAVAVGSPGERLAHIARVQHRPLEYWPVEWSEVGDSVVAGLDHDVRVRLARLISRQARRIPSDQGRAAWRALARQLDPRIAGEP